MNIKCKLTRKEREVLVLIAIIIGLGSLIFFYYTHSMSTNMPAATESGVQNIPEEPIVKTNNETDTYNQTAATSAGTENKENETMSGNSPAPAPAVIKNTAAKPVDTTPKTAPVLPKEPKANTGTLNSTAIVQAHNAVRTKKGLAPMTWSATLAQSAQSWSNTLQGENCKMRHDGNTSYGENIFWQNKSGLVDDGLISTGNDAVYWWAAEEKFYNYDSNTCAPGQQCGHYTQIVWRDTTEVGCGVSSCRSGSSQTDIWVCRYNPAGNYIGEKPY